MVDNVLDLQLILVVCVGVGKVSELLRELEAVGHVFGGDEVFGHLYAVVQVANLRGKGTFLKEIKLNNTISIF